MTILNGDEIKHGVDAASLAIMGATWINWLPDIAAVFTMFWIAIRIWESDTVRKWTKRTLK